MGLGMMGLGMFTVLAWDDKVLPNINMVWVRQMVCIDNCVNGCAIPTCDFRNCVTTFDIMIFATSRWIMRLGMVRFWVLRLGIVRLGMMGFWVHLGRNTELLTHINVIQVVDSVGPCQHPDIHTIINSNGRERLTMLYTMIVDTMPSFVPLRRFVMSIFVLPISARWNQKLLSNINVVWIVDSIGLFEGIDGHTMIYSNFRERIAIFYTIVCPTILQRGGIS